MIAPVMWTNEGEKRVVKKKYLEQKISLSLEIKYNVVVAFQIQNRGLLTSCPLVEFFFQQKVLFIFYVFIYLILNPFVTSLKSHQIKWERMFILNIFLFFNMKVLNEKLFFHKFSFHARNSFIFHSIFKYESNEIS